MASQPTRFRIVDGAKRKDKTKSFILLPGSRVISVGELEWHWVHETQIVDLAEDSTLRVPMDWEEGMIEEED